MKSNFHPFSIHFYLKSVFLHVRGGGMGQERFSKVPTPDLPLLSYLKICPGTFQDLVLTCDTYPSTFIWTSSFHCSYCPYPAQFVFCPQQFFLVESSFSWLVLRALKAQAAPVLLDFTLDFLCSPVNQVCKSYFYFGLLFSQ